MRFRFKTVGCSLGLLILCIFGLGTADAWGRKENKMVIYRDSLAPAKSPLSKVFSKRTWQNWVYGPFVQVPVAVSPLVLNPIILQSPTWATLGKLSAPFGIATWIIAAGYNSNDIPKGICVGLIFYGIQLVRGLCIVIKQTGESLS